MNTQRHGIRTRRKLHQARRPDRPQDPSQGIDGADESERGSPPAGRKEVANHGHRHRQQRSTAGALNRPPHHHAWQVGRDCADDGSDEKKCQRAWNASVRPTYRRA